MSDVWSTQATQTELWQHLVREGSARTHATLDEDLESYLVFTLMRLTQDRALLARVMALDFLEACGRSGRVRQQQLRDVGDRCLILVGLFPEQARRRHVTLGYFSSLGQEAYDELGVALKHSLGELYRRLAATFGVLTRVLIEVRRRAEGERWIDALQRHELCEREGGIDPIVAAHEFPGAIVLAAPSRAQ